MIDLDAIENRHIAAMKPTALTVSAATESWALMRESFADMSDLIAEVRRLQPLARKYERLMETHTVVKGVSLG